MAMPARTAFGVFFRALGLAAAIGFRIGRLGGEVRIDDALVVFRVLEVVFSGDAVSGRQRVARQGFIPVMNLRGAAFHLDAWAVALIVGVETMGMAAA